MPILHCAEASDIGLVRETNEDALWSEVGDPAAYAKKGALFVVADGVGGLPRGEVASRMAVDTVRDAFRSLAAQPGDRWLPEAFEKAHRAIRADSARHRGEDPMATTLTAGWFFADALFVAHVGDSRLYRVRAREAMSLTRDHASARHTLLRAVGFEEKLKTDFFKEKIQPSDAYFLATDGLFPLFRPDEMAEIALGGTPEEACRRFVDAAKSRGGPDNITVQVIRVE